MKKYNVAVVGAMGAVGQEMLRTLERRSFPVKEIIPLDVSANVSKEILFNGKTLAVKEAKAGAFKDVDIALFSAGEDASRELAPIAVSEGCKVIDNSSTWRMDESVPLVVPEVNPEALRSNNGIIANPNCTTIQMLVALKPVHDLYTIKRIVVSTYQAVSGSGQKAIEELENQASQYARGEEITHEVYPHQILFNAIPHIDTFMENGYSKEEMKMINETHKILDPSIKVSPTTVRVAVFRGHSESINIETEKPIDISKVREVLSKSEGIIVIDDPGQKLYPMAINCKDKYDVFVGRIRLDKSVENGLNLWVVADNLLKGAALNAVQIAEKMVEMSLM
ncbi:MAG TPA: aspartate-semialdehyde dehydrogenase [Clostridiales bacterium]|nr:aspartate-semialdehyde dehydrogenase [Clostridiales bacterium]